jgi:uncharacterized protein (DUF697 family)
MARVREPSFEEPPLGGRAAIGAKRRLRDLIQQERRRSQIHIDFIRRTEPEASNDRVANVMLERWSKLATVEGGMTGAAGLFGVPLNLLLFSYIQVAVVVSIAEAYGIALDGRAGEEALLDVIGQAHGMPDLVQAGPRVLGALAKAFALKHGLSTLGRLIPMIAAPISAALNRRAMARIGRQAMERFGNVFMIE